MKQEQINSNVHERLSDIEVHQQVITPLLFALIETHPSPQQLKDRFTLTIEQLLASAIPKPLPDAWFAQLNLYRGLFDRLLDQRILEDCSNGS